jgi:hypothetical protein
MKRLLPLLVVLGIAGLPALAISIYESPDVPTDLSFTTYLPWDIVRNDSGAYALALSLPAYTAVDALHQRCDGNWLLSVEAPTDLGAVTYEPRDVILFDGVSTYSPFFCGGPVGIPDGVDVDAAFLTGGDGGDLVLSFDAPTDLSALGGTVYDPADLVRFAPMGPPGCASWTLVAAPLFDASAAAVPTSINVTAADQRGPLTILSFDVPATLGGSTFLPGQLVSWNGTAFASFYLDVGWPISSRDDAISLLADPGTVPATPSDQKIHLAKATVSPLTVTITWSPSSSAGAEDYGIYEGTLVRPWVYNHADKVCTDSGGDSQETISPQAPDSYYLVVPLNANDEGSYGTDSAGAERPAGTTTCRPTQGLGCP